jgi:hypothetical protein
VLTLDDADLLDPDPNLSANIAAIPSLGFWGKAAALEVAFAGDLLLEDMVLKAGAGDHAVRVEFTVFVEDSDDEGVGVVDGLLAKDSLLNPGADANLGVNAEVACFL